MLEKFLAYLSLLEKNHSDNDALMLNIVELLHLLDNGRELSFSQRNKMLKKYMLRLNDFEVKGIDKSFDFSIFDELSQDLDMYFIVLDNIDQLNNETASLDTIFSCIEKINTHRCGNKRLKMLNIITTRTEHCDFHKLCSILKRLSYGVITILMDNSNI